MKYLIQKVLGFVLLCTISLNANDTVTIDTVKGKITVPKNPKKVMIFDFAVLDTIAAFEKKDLEIGVPIKNLPVIYKNYNKKIVDLGGMKDPNLEKVFVFKPDIIFINERTATSYKDLKMIAPVVFIQLDYSDYINSAKKLSQNLAKIFEKETFVQERFNTIDSKVKEINEITQKSDNKTLIILTNNKRVSTYVTGSRFGFIFSDLGLKPVDKNIKPSKHGQGINYEYISKMEPDTLLVIDRTVIGGSKSLATKTLDNDLVKNTKAGKKDKIVHLESETWYMMPGGLNAINIQLEEIKNSL